MISQKEKLLISLKAFLPEDKEIARIIQYCKLEPVFNSYKLWQDTAGNVLEIDERNKFKIKIKDDAILYRDLYLSAPIKSLVDNSKVLILSKINDDYDVWMFSLDIRIRHFKFIKNKWTKSLPPLISGLNPLRKLIQNLSIKEIITTEKITSLHNTEQDIIILPTKLMNVPQLDEFRKVI